MDKKISMATLGVAAYMISAPLFAEETQVVSLEELRSLCLEHQNHEQLKPGKIQFKCRKEVEFWTHTGTKPMILPNEGSLCVQAYIKGQSESTEWWNVPHAVRGQTGQCEEYDQWKAVSMYAEPGTCDLLEKISQVGSEDAYCEAVMEEHGLISEMNVSIQKMQQNPEQTTEISENSPVTVMQKTGKTRRCEDSCQAPEDTSTSTSSTSSSSSSSSSSDSSSSSSSDSSSDGDTCANTEAMLGATVHQATINKGFLRANHKVVVVDTNPVESSALHRLGLMKGDQIEKINGKRMRDKKDLVKKLKDSKGKDVVVSYTRQGRALVRTTKTF